MADTREQVYGNEGIALDRQKLVLEPGAFVTHGDTVCRITQLLDFDTVIGIETETGRTRALRVGELRPITQLQDKALEKLATADINEIGDDDWKIAEKRYAAIEPLLKSGAGRQAVSARSMEIGVNTATLYRWLKRYTSVGVISVLIPKKRGWQEGNIRISKHVEKVIQDVIADTYLTVQRSSAQKTIQEVYRRCKIGGLEPPHETTIRSRIAAISEKTRLRGRGYREIARNKFLPVPGNFPNADYPLAVVQIDHTPVDLILVDDQYRKPIGRPWLTLAIDVYSRMVTGYYLSFDPPSETSVAMCVAHSILPKDEWLALHDVAARWDVWGMMTTIHTDNGAEFRSDNFRQSCLMHNINLEFRPVKQPRYGGHIERLLGTLLREIHHLPGTTFSSIKNREGYDSEKHAALTIAEFEKWFVTLICKVYHQRLHKSIGMTPTRKWELGTFGHANTPGHGLPPRPIDRHALLLDFLPSFLRTVQNYGVSIDGLNYYADILRAWINAVDPVDPQKKRDFIFRRDPRDISCVWFYDPEIKQYFKVPFANQKLPAMSFWEFQEARNLARKHGMKSVDEQALLNALTELRTMVKESEEKTKAARRRSQRRKEHEKRVSPAIPLVSPTHLIESKSLSEFDGFSDGEVTAFDDYS